MNGEELFAELGGGSLEHSGERAGIFGAKEADEGFEFFRFLAEIAGRPNQASKTRERDAFKGKRSQQAFAAEIRDCALDIRPRSVLRQDGADDDFEGCASGPPVLRAEVAGQSFIVQRRGIRTVHDRTILPHPHRSQSVMRPSVDLGRVMCLEFARAGHFQKQPETVRFPQKIKVVWRVIAIIVELATTTDDQETAIDAVVDAAILKH